MILSQRLRQSTKLFSRWYSAGWSSESLKSRLIQKGPSHLSYPGLQPLIVDKTIADQLDFAAETWPNRECLVSKHQNVRLTFSDVQRRVNKLAAGFTKIGLKQGDRVGLWSPNCAEWYLTFLACCKLGLVLVALNPSYQQSELEYCLDLVNAKAMVSADTFKTQNYVEMILKAKSKNQDLKHLIVNSQNHYSGTRRFVDVETLATNKEVDQVKDLQRSVQPQSPCNIQFTSGSTGRPKAATISQLNILNNSRQPVDRLGFDKEPPRICLNVPFFHAFALVMGHISVLHHGGTIILEGSSFNPVKSLEVIVDEKCTVTYGTPTMWVNMISAQQKLNLPLSTLKVGAIGGSPASSQLFKNIRKHLRFDDITSIYGLTECTGLAFESFIGEPHEMTENHVGFISDHTEVMIVDEKGKSVPFGTPGELWVKGYHTMLGYWKDEENTKKTITDDGWLKTGDRFTLREDGYGVIVGRLKDVIIRGGENIFPKEIEGFFETHPAISEAYAFGAYDQVFGEEICICVKLEKNAKICAEDLRAYCKGQIAHFKIPRYIVFTDDFPKTTSGKIQKAQLREMIEDRGVIPRKPRDAA